MSDEQFWKYFNELFESIPRQGPGLNTMTAKAVGFLPRLRADQRILDIGCGSGVQTLELARRTDAKIVATDLHAPYFETLNRNATKEGLADRIMTQVADMGDLPFEDASFDVVWAEGSIFIIGFDKGLALWRRLVKPSGYLVVSDLTWYDDNPPEDVRNFCLIDPNEDISVEKRRQSIADAGYELLEEFRLPQEGWWNTYYLPLIEQLGPFEKRHQGNEEALSVAKRSRYEVELYKRYPEFFSYTFFILKR